MGVTVRQKRRGRGQPWSVFIHVNHTIRSKQIGDKRAAEAVASAIRQKLKAGELKLETVRKPKTPTFSDYATHYLDFYARAVCKATTLHGYKAIIEKHLLPSWKGKRLDEIKRADVKSLLRCKRDEGLAAKTVENIKALISGMFTQACEDEILAVNPALRLGRFIQRKDRRVHMLALPRDDVGAVLAATLEHFPDHYPLMLCAFRTGMRMGELLGLAWGDVDFPANRITVQRAYTHGLFTTPKSHRSRIVDMSDQLGAVLAEHRTTLTENFGGRQPSHEVPGHRGAVNEVQFVFPSKTGGPLCGDNFRKRVFYRIIDLGDVPRFRFHDIRHTFASLLLAQGESLHYVKEQMGHSSIQTTVDVYGHLVPGSNRNAVNRLDDPDTAKLRIVGHAG